MLSWHEILTPLTLVSVSLPIIGIAMYMYRFRLAKLWKKLQNLYGDKQHNHHRDIRESGALVSSGMNLGVVARSRLYWGGESRAARQRDLSEQIKMVKPPPPDSAV